MSKKCSSGQILKKGYKRHSYIRKTGTKVKSTKVHSTCIKKRGQPTKSKVKIPGMKNYAGLLRSFGYELHLSKDARRKALLRALNKIDPLFILRRLVSLRTFRKFEREQEPKEKQNYDALNEDIMWLSTYYKLNDIKQKRQKILSRSGEKATSFIGLKKLKNKKLSKKQMSRLTSWQTQ